MDIANSPPGDQTNAAPKPVASAKIPVTRMGYYGKAGEIFRLHLMNLLMNIITIGIYSFWGKTRIRKYMSSHLVIAKDRFEYTGTGKELLFGWLKAMLIFLPLIVCLSIPGLNLIAYPVFFGILSLAMYLALRYRLSRTRWRGIKFHLGGSLKEYFFLSLKRTLINIFTLGIRIPKSDILLWSYIANNMSYGDLKFSYQGDYNRIKKIHYISLSIFIAAIILPIVFGGIMKGQELIQAAREKQAYNSQVSHSPESPVSETQINQLSPQAGQEDGTIKSKKSSEDGMVGFVLLIYLAIGIGFISRLWYYAALWQEKFRGLRLANLRFKADITGGGLAKLFITNLLIIIFSLGLAKPIALHRTLRFYATNMRIGGDLNELIAQQDRSRKLSGMGDALAADVGFDLGL